jgi:hypothetical protein
MSEELELKEEEELNIRLTSAAVGLENPDDDEALEERKRISHFRKANLTLHDIHAVVHLMNVMGNRHGYNEDETEFVEALKGRFKRFLNFNVPEDYDIAADREATRKFAEEEYAKVQSGEIKEQERLDPTGGAPFPM